MNMMDFLNELSVWSLLEYVIYIIGFLFIVSVLRRLSLQVRRRYLGYVGEKRVYRKLKKISKGRFAILNDVLLPLYNNYTQIDHVVIGPFGVVCIETKNHSGHITGGMNDIYWIQRIGRKKHKLYNPLAQNNTHCLAVKYFLKEENLSHVPICNLVVFSSDHVSVNLKENNLPVIPLSYLKKFFKKNLENRDVNVEEVFAVIKKYNIIDKKTRRRHIQRLKEAYQ